MARINIFADLEKIQDEELQIPEGTMEFKTSLDLASVSQPITGLAKLISRTKTGNYKYAVTAGKQKHQFFYSKVELTDLKLQNYKFGIQEVTDKETGEVKTFYWY